jgi:hypothetical protein
MDVREDQVLRMGRLLEDHPYIGSPISGTRCGITPVPGTTLAFAGKSRRVNWAT